MSCRIKEDGACLLLIAQPDANSQLIKLLYALTANFGFGLKQTPDFPPDKPCALGAV